MPGAPPDRDAARHREVRRFLESWQVAQGSSLNVALNVDTIAISHLDSAGYTPQPSPDRALVAFAQLVVLRLGVRRAMVSLIDNSTQTILAEATGDDSILSPGGDGPRTPSSLWLGTTTLARHEAVCEHCLNNSYTAVNNVTHNGLPRTYTAPAFVVSDCSIDPRFQNRSYVREAPFVRFYAGVPIVSRSGHKIGALAVSDDRPRDGLDVQELQFMQGLAVTAMEHLEWAQDRVDRFKGERIVRGLAAFIEGLPASSDTSPSRAADRSETTLRPSRLTVTSPRHPLSRRSSYFGNAEANETQPQSPKPPAAIRPRVSRGSSFAKSKPDTLSAMLKQAADILCQATLADGAMILGASTSSSRQTSWAAHAHGRQSSDEEEPFMEFPGSPTPPAEYAHSGVDVAAQHHVKMARVLAYSFTSDQTRAEFEQARGALTAATLDRYYSLFPRGKTFSFTSQGSSINSSGDDSASEPEVPVETLSWSNTTGVNGRRRQKSRMDHTELLRRIPGTKTIVFVPLFDHTEDSFAGGIFLWTSVSGRMINLDDDLSYLRAFANSIMSQVARISAQKNEAAKTTFIASMSHELRSPLHGILGAAEFLADTSSDSYQASLISSISTCGKTLLDTLNHVLDYSKINKLGRSHLRRTSRKEKPPTGTPSDQLDSLNLMAVIDLSALVEEVVDAIVTGHTFKKLPSTALSRLSKQPIISGFTASSSTLDKDSEEPVSVLLDISPPGAWLVRTQPGALRRIVMNLFGNALKYTDKGFVLVSLRIEQTSGSAMTTATLRVTDTGKGMSAEFQNERLFMPFMQEDPFQPGTGLGLSIVKQIVDSLGGSINVNSEKGKGTDIEVRSQLSTSLEHPHLGQELRWIREHVGGLRMVILDGNLDAEKDHVAKQADKLNQTVAETCMNWFGLEVGYEEEGASLDADLFMYCEPPSMDTLEKRFKDDKTLSKRKWQIPVIIVCLNAQEVLRISQNQKKALTTGFGRIVELIPQPCGPRKLAKVIELCLRKAEELAQKSESELHSNISEPVKFPNAEKSVSSPPRRTSEEPHLDSKDHQQQILQTEPTSLPVRSVHHVKHYNSSATSGSKSGQTENHDIAKSPSPTPSPALLTTPRSPVISAANKDSNKSHDSKTSKSLSEPNIRKPHVLLVDDNKINLQLLVMFMKKTGLTYEQAENGKQALDIYKAAAEAAMKSKGQDNTEQQPSPPPSPQQQQEQQREQQQSQPEQQDSLQQHQHTQAHTTTAPPCRAATAFDYILMDISMPVMDGIESTLHIREFERERGRDVLRPATVVALTGLASADAQREAKAAGMDIFMAKPVRFAALKEIILAPPAAGTADGYDNDDTAVEGRTSG